MISIDKIKDAAKAADYYSRLDDYYREQGQAPAELAGRGAEFLGIAGVVTGAREDAARVKAFGEILAGRINGVQVGDAKTRVAGWDVTIQAPKSFSIAAAHDSRLRDVHDAAERRVFAHLEKHGIQTRQRNGEGGYEWHSADVVAMCARHTTNRNQDEHWHSHLVLASAVRDRQTGDWRSLDARELYAIRGELEGIYQNALALGGRESGYTVDWTIDSKGNPSGELREVPESLRLAASSRKTEIDQELAAHGVSREEASVAQRQAATLATRQIKAPVADRAALHASWRERAIEHGYDPDAKRGVLIGEDQRLAAVNDAVKQAVAHLAERDMRFSARDLAHESRMYAQGHAGDEDIAAAIARAQQRGELITRQSWGRVAGGQRGHREGFTTAAGVKTERLLLASARRLESGGKALAGPAVAAAAIAAREKENGRPMTDEQRTATTAILGSDSRLQILQGHAGTAKTTSVLAAVADQAKASGVSVRAMAPTSSAKDTLTEAVGVKAETVAAVLHEQQKAGAPRGRELWIVDESGMIAAKDMRDLLARAERAGATIILAGDRQQIGSVGAGAAYSQLSDAVRPEHKHQLTQIVRQSNETLRGAVYAALSGRVREALQKADTQEVKGRVGQIAAAAERYQAAIGAGKSALVVTLSRADRTDVNKEIHDQRVAAGQVRDAREVQILDSKQWTDSQRGDAARYQQGDVIVWGAAHRRGPDKGEQTRVLESRDGFVTVAREDGSQWQFNPRTTTRFDVYDARALEVGRGDVLVTRAAMNNADGERIGNGTRLEVTGVHADRLTVRNDAGKRFDIDTRRGLHIDHGYAMTADQAQGRTSDTSIGVIRSGQENLANLARLYVIISRAREAGVIITDDLQKLAQTLEKNTGARQQALETEREREPERAHPEQREHAQPERQGDQDWQHPLPGAIAEWLSAQEWTDPGQAYLPPMQTEFADPEDIAAAERGRQQLAAELPELEPELDDLEPDPDGPSWG